MKKKFFALGIALLAGVTLAACDSNNQTTTTATATDTATATATVDDGLTYHEGYEATYTTKGMKPYYTRGKKPGYLDENKQTCTLDDLLIDYLTLEGKVTSVDTLGFAHTNIPVEDFFKAFNYEYMLTITVDGKEPVDVPYVKWINELADGDVALGVDEDVIFLGDTAKAEELGLKENVTFTLKYNDSKLYKSKYEAMNHLYEKGPVDVSGKELTLTYTKGAQDTYLAKAQAVLDALEAEEVEGEEILALYDEFVDTYYMLVDEYRKAKIISDKDNGKEDYEIADELEALVDDFGAQDELIDIAAYKSKYKEIYYLEYDEYKNTDGTLNEEAVKAYVDGLDPEATAALNEISQRMSGALSSFYAKESTAAEALTAYLTAAKDYATATGYSDYLHYAYEENFGREYTVEDSNDLATYVKEYIIPAYDYCQDVFDEFDEASAADAKTTRVYANAWNEMIALYNNFYGNYFKYFADYTENVIGDEMAENFKYYFESGNYWYSATENGNVTGYVWSFADGTPLMFLGYEDQAARTFIHEFGHYNEAITAKDSDFYSMDLNEVHSQGNEMLFYLYLTTTDAASEIATYEFLNYMTMSMLGDGVISGYLINEIEKWAYTQDMTTYATAKEFETALFAKWTEICKESGVEFMAQYTSWVEKVLLNYQGYYISYATSAIAALELYAVAVEDYDTAVAAYKKLYAPHEATDTFTSVLEEAGLYSVFNEEAYKKIANAVIVEEE